MVSVAEAKRALGERERERLMQASIQEAYNLRIQSMYARLNITRDKVKTLQVNNRTYDSPGALTCVDGGGVSAACISVDER